MLTYPNKNEIETETLLESNIIKRFISKKDKKTLDSIVDILHKHIEDRAIKAITKNESSYTIFGILLGDNGILSNDDVEYRKVWDLAHDAFNEGDFAKRFLGTVQMIAFSLSKHHWIIVNDDEKDEKIKNGEIPLANKFFLHNRGAMNEMESLDLLVKKFGR